MSTKVNQQKLGMFGLNLALPPVCMPTRNNSIQVNHTPKKVTPIRKASSSTLVSPLNVANLPGKKKLKIRSATKTKVTGKCQICGIIYESKEGKAFCKKNGQRKTTWL